MLSRHERTNECYVVLYLVVCLKKIDRHQIAETFTNNKH